MKKISKTIIILLALLIAASCNEEEFLTKNPLSSATVDFYYKTEAHAIAAINAVYGSLQPHGFYRSQFFYSYGAMGDDVKSNETPFNVFSYNASDSRIRDLWSLCYQGVFRANLVINRVPLIENNMINETIRQRVLGEAYFLRALYYWHLVTIWGEVPVFTKVENDISNYDATKKSINEVWAQIESDLVAAKSKNLPEKYDNKNVGRVTSGAVHALLGKAFLYQKKYTEAANEFKNIIGKYSLVDDPNLIFSVNNENNQESIFEIQYHNQGGNPWHNEDSPSSSEGTMRNVFFAPSQCLGAWENYFPSPKLVDAYENGDLRKQAYMFADGDLILVNNNGEVRYDHTRSKTTSKHSIKKGMMPIRSSNSGYDDNWILIRYADVLLMYAEALANGGGTEDPAIYVNMVRKRAFGSNYNETTHGVRKLMEQNGWDMMAAIKHERFVELPFENHRFPDLVRWNDAQSELGSSFSEKFKYWPIPQTEVDRSKGQLVQNPNWQ